MKHLIDRQEIGIEYAYYLLRHELAVVTWVGEENTYLRDVEWEHGFFVKGFLSLPYFQ